jgi:hypothetical protein
VPFPANYGGIIDVYYKLVWLKKEGVKVHLHCFTYGRQPAKELEALCEKVYYYPRKIGLSSGLSWQPYTVKSRKSAELEKNLLSNDYPILFEVLHTCYLLNDPRFKNRVKIYRHSNIEHEYYARLADSEKSLSRKLYLKTEAKRLERFERIIDHADYILAVNNKDADYFKKKYSHPRTIYLPSFHPNDEINIKPGKGDYILYHWNLSISENYEAALWLTKNIFEKIKHKVVIAGLNPPQFLKTILSGFSHIELIENPSEEKMNELVQNAQVHCLYTEQATGLKLKLLNVLFKGRFLICNSKMISGTELKGNANSGFHVLNAQEMIEALEGLMTQEMTEEQINNRTKDLSIYFNHVNIQKLKELL